MHVGFWCCSSVDSLDHVQVGFAEVKSTLLCGVVGGEWFHYPDVIYIQ